MCGNTNGTTTGPPCGCKYIPGMRSEGTCLCLSLAICYLLFRVAWDGWLDGWMVGWLDDWFAGCSVRACMWVLVTV